MTTSIHYRTRPGKSPELGRSSRRSISIPTMDQPALRKRSGWPQIASASDHPQLMLASVIERVSIETLAPYAGNSRKHDQRQVAKLCSIMKKVGMLVPFLVDEKGEIIAGHERLLACKELGMSLVPVIRVGHLSPDQIRAFRIADNRLAELSTWDDEALAIELHHLVHSIEDPEIIELTSLEIGEVDARLEILDEKPKQDPADERLEPAAGPPISKSGDLWELGNHRLFCGSSIEAESYSRLLQGIKVRSVWSDPPYNVKIQGHVSGLGKAHHREFEMASGEMDEAEFIAFLFAYLALTRANSLPGSLHYCCMGALHSYEFLTAARQAGLHLKTICTWAKTNAGMGSMYRQQRNSARSNGRSSRSSHSETMGNGG